MDIFEKVTSITDDLDTIVEVVCPELRPSVYYMERVFNHDWMYSPIYARKFLNNLPKGTLIELNKNLGKLTGLMHIDQSDSIEEIVKSVLEYSYTFTFGRTWLQRLTQIFTSASSLDNEMEEVFTIGKSILNICNGITKSEFYPKLSELLRDKSAVRPLVFGILAIRKIVECELVKTELSEMEIVRLSLLYWTAIMRYHLNNMHSDVWLPKITKLITRDGGRYFRLCMTHETKSIPLFKTIFPNTVLERAVKPDWHNQLYRTIETSEILSSYKGLHKLFLFHIIDQFLIMCANPTGKSGQVEDVFGALRPYPDYNTLQRYFNLYLGTPIYTEKIDCSSWNPDKLLYKLLSSNYPDYNDCLNAMRNEYFPEEMFDLNCLISAACEFYDDKFHLDVSRNIITDFTMFDSVSIWLTSEWIINNRNYPFLEGLTLSELAEMIGSTITSSKN